MIYIVFNILHECGMSNINVFSGEILYLDYIVISNGTSIKHIKSTAFKLVKQFKSKYDFSIYVSGINSDWIIIDIGSMLIHLMLLKSRQLYELDSLYEEKSKKIIVF